MGMKLPPNSMYAGLTRISCSSWRIPFAPYSVRNLSQPAGTRVANNLSIQTLTPAAQSPKCKQTTLKPNTKYLPSRTPLSTKPDKPDLLHSNNILRPNGPIRQNFPDLHIHPALESLPGKGHCTVHLPGLHHSLLHHHFFRQDLHLQPRQPILGSQPPRRYMS